MTAVELATFRAKPHHGDAMAAGPPAAAGVIAVADGCVGATAMRCIERRDEFVLRVECTEVAKHLPFGSPLTLIAIAVTSRNISNHSSGSLITTSCKPCKGS